MMLKEKRLEDKDYTKHFIPKLPCAYHGKHVQCDGQVVAAHIRIGSGAGIAQKPDDSRTIPLCHAHHGHQHQKGELRFHGAFLRDAVGLANCLYEAYLNHDFNGATMFVRSFRNKIGKS